MGGDFPALCQHATTRRDFCPSSDFCRESVATWMASTAVIWHPLLGTLTPSSDATRRGKPRSTYVPRESPAPSVSFPPTLFRKLPHHIFSESFCSLTLSPHDDCWHQHMVDACGADTGKTHNRELVRLVHRAFYET